MGAVYWRKIAFAAVVCLVAQTNRNSRIAYITDVMAPNRSIFNPLFRVRTRTVTAAKKDRKNVSWYASREVSFISTPPVLHIRTAINTSTCGGKGLTDLMLSFIEKKLATYPYETSSNFYIAGENETPVRSKTDSRLRRKTGSRTSVKL